MEQLVPENVNTAHDHAESSLIVLMLETFIVSTPVRDLPMERPIDTIGPVALNQEGIVQKAA